jgi:hypothetical protein
MKTVLLVPTDTMEDVYSVVHLKLLTFIEVDVVMSVGRVAFIMNPLDPRNVFILVLMSMNGRQILVLTNVRQTKKNQELVVTTRVHPLFLTQMEILVF